MQRTTLWILALLILLATPAVVQAQTSTGSLAGTVADEQGGGLPGAMITVTNSATGFSRSGVTTEKGDFRLLALPPGNYSVKVELAGFATLTTEGVVINVATTRTLAITLKQAKVKESLTVTAEAPLVEMTPAVGAVVSQQELETLPLNGRQFANLAVLAPGTTLDYNTDPTKPGQLVVALNGGSGRNVNYIMDGGDNTDDTIGGALQNFNLEAVQEFKIQTMQYKAEYGRSSGGVLTVISKGGTNDFAGSVYGFFRKDAWNSKTETENLAGSDKAAYDRKQYGFSLGGPIVKDQIHFFATAERTKRATSYTMNTGGLFPTYDGLTTPIPFQDDMVTAKATYDIDAKQYLQVRYGYQKNSDKYGANSLTAPSALGTITNKYSSILAGYTSQLGADKLNEFVFQYTKFDDNITADSDQPFLYYPSGFNTGRNVNSPQSTHQVKYQYKDDFSFSKTIAGKAHDFKTGINYIHEPTLSGDFSTGTTGQFSMLQDRIGSPVQSIVYYSGFSGNKNHSDQYSVYFQDDWRVSPNVTVNMGLRYDYFDALELDQRTNPNWKVLSTQTRYNESYLQDFKGGQGGVLGNEKTDWAPRIGFTWDMNNNGKNILRGGVGRFYDFPYINATILFPTSAVQSTGYGISYFYNDDNGIKNPNGTFFQPGQPLPTSQLPPGAGGTREIASPTLKPPYSDQISLGYSWQVNSWLGLNFEGVGAQYRHIPFRFRINGTDPATGQLRFPTLDPRLRLWYGKGEADYKGINIGFHLRGEKFEVQGFYTLSKSEGNVLGGADEFRITRVEYQPDLAAVRDQSVNPYDPLCGACTGPLDTDARHRITLAAIYMLPYDFSVSGMFRYHSATPYTAWAGVDLNGDKLAFDLPPGVSNVNSLRGSDFKQLDLRVSKDVKIDKGFGVEVLAEMFNVFNWKNPSGYIGNRSSGAYGQPSTYAGDPAQGEQRLIQLGVRVHF